MDKMDLMSQVSDPEVMQEIVKISEINRKEKNGDLTSEEAAEKVVDIAEDNPELKTVLGMLMQQFGHDKVAEKIEEKMIERFGEDWEDEQGED